MSRLANLLLSSFVLATSALALPASAEVDEDAAISLAKKGHCFKCHAVEKRKKAPSYREVAKKYSGKPDAEKTVYLHITGTPVVKLEEGDEPHAKPPTQDQPEIENLIKWILSRDKVPKAD